MPTTNPALRPRCRHGRNTGSYELAAALGAFSGSRGRPAGIANPVPGSPIAGTAVAVKENIDVQGWPTRAGSEATPNEPAARDAVVVERLRAAGAIIAAQTRMDEFALATSGPGMQNPADHLRSVGGSSGGSALAVAVGGFCVALGTDTGGSVRIPASYCGVVGFKPTYDRVPVDGVVPFSTSLDHVGLIACSVPAIREAFTVIGDRGDAPHDAVPALQDVRIGVPRRAYLDAATEPVRRAFDRYLADLVLRGCTIAEVDLPAPQLVLAAHYPIALVEARRYHSTRFGNFASHGEIARAILESAKAYSEHDYLEALEAREAFVASAARLFADIDVLAMPTTPTSAPLLSDPMITLGDRTVDGVTGNIWYTALFNVTGLPAISLPVLEDGLLPVGLQLVARWGADDFLLDVAEQI